MDKFNFKFDLDQRVITPFEADGIVTMLGYDDGGRKYYIQTQDNSDWFKECTLRTSEDV